MNYKILNFSVLGDIRGSLVSLESNKNVPFEIKRVYYIYNTNPEQERGKHSHKELEQIIVCLNGSCSFVLDDGKKREILVLNRPDIGLYIGKNMWREMKNFSKGCILMILASQHFIENEYIRDYKEFLKCLEK